MFQGKEEYVETEVLGRSLMEYARQDVSEYRLLGINLLVYTS